ncbi:MAG TPA: acyl-CoA dehydrogenase family protein, partial [Inquilinus sp.]
MPPQTSLRDANPSDAASAGLERMLAEIRGLAPQIAARVQEFEAARRTPPDLVETLRSIGVFRIFAPRSHGGLELELPQAAEVITALSRIDGSVGWTAMIGSASAMFLPLLPRETYD